MNPGHASTRTLIHYGLFIPFAILFALTAIAAALGAWQMCEMLVQPDDWFGDESSQARAADIAMSVTALYINIQSLAVSALLYRCNQKVAGIAVLLLPLLLGTYLASNYGMPR